jgi:uncharacterized membrane protein
MSIGRADQGRSLLRAEPFAHPNDPKLTGGLRRGWTLAAGWHRWAAVGSRRVVGAVASHEGSSAGEEGQILILLLGLVGMILMVLGLGWDASNWFLGHRALDNLADGAAVAAASDVDLRAFYASGGREIAISKERALGTVRRYLTDAAGDSGLDGIRVRVLRVGRAATGPRVTVELQARTPVAFLSYLSVVAPEMTGSATATAELEPP